jgi:hypothetical protein
MSTILIKGRQTGITPTALTHTHTSNPPPCPHISVLVTWQSTQFYPDLASLFTTFCNRPLHSPFVTTSACNHCAVGWAPLTTLQLADRMWRYCAWKPICLTAESRNASVTQVLCVLQYICFSPWEIRMKFEMEQRTINTSVLVSITWAFELSLNIFPCHGARDWPFLTDPHMTMQTDPVYETFYKENSRRWTMYEVIGTAITSVSVRHLKIWTNF